MGQRLIDADAVEKVLEEKHFRRVLDSDRWLIADIRKSIMDLPTIDAIPISFIEEQVKLCNEIGFRRGEECYMSLIEKWREKNETKTD